MNSSIKNYDYGKRCFYVLWGLMSSSFFLLFILHETYFSQNIQWDYIKKNVILNNDVMSINFFQLICHIYRKKNFQISYITKKNYWKFPTWIINHSILIGYDISAYAESLLNDICPHYSVYLNYFIWCKNVLSHMKMFNCIIFRFVKYLNNISTGHCWRCIYFYF